MNRAVRNVLRWTLVFTVTFGLAFGASALMASRLTRVSGDSMNPTYMDGDLLTTKTMSGSDDAVAEDDVVILRKPKTWTLNHEDKTPDIVKRVVAVGPTVLRMDGDGKIHSMESGDDPVDAREDDVDLAECRTGASRVLSVPEGYVFIRGDNVNNSYDSRWAWCHDEDPLVPESSVLKVVTGRIPVGGLFGKIGLGKDPDSSAAGS